MDPKISVIIPVYNAEKYLRKCLDSVMHQTIFDQLEVVAVNDGSTDASGSILADYADKYSNVNVMTQKNQDIAKARQAGLKNTQGGVYRISR
jgi:glycosyltransferase involved in cell wall biosynthesis